jgi:hypothetical protein
LPEGASAAPLAGHLGLCQLGGEVGDRCYDRVEIRALRPEHGDADFIRGNRRDVDLGPVGVVDLDGVTPRCNAKMLANAIPTTTLRRPSGEFHQPGDGRMEPVAAEQVP